MLVSSMRILRDCISVKLVESRSEVSTSSGSNRGSNRGSWWFINIVSIFRVQKGMDQYGSMYNGLHMGYMKMILRNPYIYIYRIM